MSSLRASVVSTYASSVRRTETNSASTSPATTVVRSAKSWYETTSRSPGCHPPWAFDPLRDRGRPAASGTSRSGPGPTSRSAATCAFARATPPPTRPGCGWGSRAAGPTPGSPRWSVTVAGRPGSGMASTPTGCAIPTRTWRSTPGGRRRISCGSDPGGWPEPEPAGPVRRRSAAALHGIAGRRREAGPWEAAGTDPAVERALRAGPVTDQRRSRHAGIAQRIGALVDILIAGGA